MKKIFLFLFSFSAVLLQTFAQKIAADESAVKTPVLNRMVKTDTAVVSKNQVTIKGQLVAYTATAGTIPVWDEDGKPVAGVFYTYYERSDVKDRAARPLVISFNGGPGTPASCLSIPL